MISVILVRERSTSCGCIHRSQAAGPIQVKSGGRVREVRPASRKQHSGKQRVRPCGLYSVSSRLICRKAVHLRKARGMSSACGEERAMVIHLILTTLAGEEAKLAIEIQEHDRFQEFENAVIEQLPMIGESTTFGCVS